MSPGPSRRRVLGIAASSLALAGCTAGRDGGSDTGGDREGEDRDDGDDGDDGSDTDGTTGDPLSEVPEAVALDPVASGLEGPVAFVDPPDLPHTYVCEQPGRIRALEEDGLRAAPALDYTSVVTSGGERGLLGLALHPNFSSNRRAFVRYSAPPRDGTPSGYSHTFVLAEFAVSSDGRRFLPETERTLLEIPEPQSNHNAGDLAFGPDGYLYVAVGDGGAANDQGTGHVEDWYDEVPGGNGQDVTENLLGSVLRIDVDGGNPYAIPEDNPLVGRPGREEHYAWGLRNPWRLSFDPGPAVALEAGDSGAGGDAGSRCYVADVGQRRYEEINLLQAGGNYGWNVREGTHCFEATSCPDGTPNGVRGGESFVDPIVEYPHGGADVAGISVIGGHVYRGGAIDGLAGSYVFGDFQPGGRLFVTARGEGDGRWPTTTLDVRESGPGVLYSIGRDAGGELYLLGRAEGGGTIWRVIPA